VKVEILHIDECATGTRFEPLPSREQLEAVFRERVT
jgi:hypothetical protein